MWISVAVTCPLSLYVGVQKQLSGSSFPLKWLLIGVPGSPRTYRCGRFSLLVPRLCVSTSVVNFSSPPHFPCSCRLNGRFSIVDVNLNVYSGEQYKCHFNTIVLKRVRGPRITFKWCQYRFSLKSCHVFAPGSLCKLGLNLSSETQTKLHMKYLLDWRLLSTCSLISVTSDITRWSVDLFLRDEKDENAPFLFVPGSPWDDQSGFSFSVSQHFTRNALVLMGSLISVFSVRWC